MNGLVRPADPWTWSICAAVLLGTAGCSRNATTSNGNELSRVELPGFSVDLPQGRVVSTSRVPTVGKHEVALPGTQLEHWLDDRAINGSVTVSWARRSENHDEWMKDDLPMYIGSVEASAPGSKLLVDEQFGSNRWMVVVGTERLPLAIGVIRCDPSFAVEISYVRFHDANRNASDMRKLVGSVKCHVTDANRARMLAATRLPGKFGEVESEDGQLFRSLDGEALVLNFNHGDLTRLDPKIHRTTMKILIRSIVEVEEIEDSQLSWVSGDLSSQPAPATLMRVDLPATRQTLYIGAIYCKQEDSTLLGLWFPTAPGDAVAIERLGQVGCPGANSKPSPSFDALVESACRSGDQAACAIKAESES